MATLRGLTCLTLLFLVVGSRADAGLLDLLIGGPVSPTELSTYRGGGEAAAEIVAYDAKTKLFLVTNAATNALDVLQLNLEEPGTPLELVDSADLSPYGAGPNSVAVHNGLVAVAVENAIAQEDGVVVFFELRKAKKSKKGKTSSKPGRRIEFARTVAAGALPDMVTFTPNGRFVLVANEGEPDGYETDDDGNPIGNDPEGTVTIVDVETFDSTTLVLAVNVGPRVRIFGPNATAAQDLEPEYITVSADSKTAYVSCQENNALATIDLESTTVVRVSSFGFKEHDQSGNGIDASDRDDAINVRNWPVFGMYQPDSIASTSLFGLIDVVWTANEGDAREYDGFEEEDRVEDLDLDPTAFPDADDLQVDDNLGRLTVTTTLGANSEGEFEELYAFGARSFSGFAVVAGFPIPIYDSGDEFEQRTAAAFPDDFNSDNDENDSFDSRSDAKGPEPEAIAVGRVGFREYAFIGLERIGGIMTYEITNPFRPEFVDYVNNRDFAGDVEAGTAGDLGPEGIVFVPASKSPIRGTALIAVANEVSGTTTVYTLQGSRGLLGLLFPGLF